MSQIRTVTTISGPYQLQEDVHPSYWGQLALRNCLRQAYNGGAPRGGTASTRHGLNGRRRAEHDARIAQGGGPADDSECVRTQASWLCPTPNHRERLFDMQPRLRTARIFTIVALCTTAVSVMGRGGSPALLARLHRQPDLHGDRRLADPRPRRPELWVFFGTLVNIQLVIASGRS